MTVPVGTRLYRYRSLAGDGRRWTEDIIRNSQLYFSPANGFNDPFEFDAVISVAGMRMELEAYFESTGLNNMAIRVLHEPFITKVIVAIIRVRDR
jgi:hypothetical protein